MQYSLLSRFRGALLGGWIGEILASKSCQGFPVASVKFAQPTSGETWNLEKGLTISEAKLSAWSQIATCGTESLIRCGKLDIENWLGQADQLHPSLLLLKGGASSSQAAVATLPVALFFHEDRIQLRQKLQQAAKVWQSDPEELSGVWVVALAIALALTEQLDCANFIPQIIAELGTKETPLIHQLQQVQLLLDQGADLETTVAQLKREQGHPADTSIALAFYFFLNTPEDFRLSTLRAARSSYQSETTVTLTGALAGVYNSITGIPVSWRLITNQIAAAEKRLHLADCLFTIWSGVWAPQAIDRCQWTAVAAPGVIQPRL
ncbi:MAG TPA: ADP-ribosylglycohydrolase family protein [Cyanobacteria bacterium UBA8803]|nr:ADP-ribosylglycohydrolase family protein [Cyanobacteria bacterium UBA9273]HBL58635.1 ADP-ribosylglycohydrolase family protein [Cyanobacteria bacterium UBA8803]